MALEELQIISEKKTSITVKNLNTKITHKKSSTGNTKKNNKKVRKIILINMNFSYNINKIIIIINRY